MTRLLRSLLASAFGFCCLSPAQQPEAMPDAKVEAVVAATIVWVFVAVHASKESVVIPVCPSIEGGPKSFCRYTVHLEVQRGGTWQPVQQRDPGRVFGEIRPDREHAATVTQGATVDFFYEYRRDLYKVEPGEKLRLVIDTWKDNASILTQARPNKLYCDSFNAP